MKINIVCVGNIKEKFYREACAEYIKRLQRFCTLTVTETAEYTPTVKPNDTQIADILKKEEQSLKGYLSGFVIANDIGGEQLCSEDFSKLISKKKTEGISEITFVTGGSYGLSEEIKKRANFLLSFSPMTFPHMLFRVMLLEQLYRGFMIESGSTYHK